MIHRVRGVFEGHTGKEAYPLTYLPFGEGSLPSGNGAIKRMQDYWQMSAARTGPWGWSGSAGSQEERGEVYGDTPRLSLNAPQGEKERDREADRKREREREPVQSAGLA